ncbi:GRAM domain-containing protein 3 isoform X2 [Silurus meridionalis]|nr:GRAM domain-containing protein 3 isoform X2 [Silurus meridionalis]
MEEYINAFSCALQKEVLYHGKMYVSQHHVCFYSSVLLKETKVQIHTSTIQIIKKKNTARVVPNAISIITSTGEKHVSANSSPQMSSAENGHEVDTISSYSSQEEHSSDPHRFSVSGPDRTEGNALLSSPIKISNGEEKNNSTSWNGTRRDDHPLEENTAVSWVTMVTEKIRFLLSMGGTTNVNKLIIVYLILALLLLLSSGYIGLRIAALEEQLTTLGATSEFSLQKT